MSGKIRKILPIVVAVVVISIGAFALPALMDNENNNGQQVNDNSNKLSPVGQAEGIIPNLIGSAEIASRAGIINDKYQPSKYFTQAENEVEYDPEQVEDKTRRQAIHNSIVISEGSHEAYLDNVDNDQLTIEGQVEQVISQRFFEVGDNVTSEAETITETNKASTEYLTGRLDNIIETQNFASQSVKFYVKQLEQSNSSSDAYISGSENWKLHKTSSGSLGVSPRKSSKYIDNFSGVSTKSKLIDITDRGRIIAVDKDKTDSVVVLNPYAGDDSITTHNYHTTGIDAIEHIEGTEDMLTVTDNKIERRTVEKGAKVWSYNHRISDTKRLEVVGDKILISDTNNENLEVVDLEKGNGNNLRTERITKIHPVDDNKFVSTRTNAPKVILYKITNNGSVNQISSFEADLMNPPQITDIEYSEKTDTVFSSSKQTSTNDHKGFLRAYKINNNSLNNIYSTGSKQFYGIEFDPQNQELTTAKNVYDVSDPRNTTQKRTIGLGEGPKISPDNPTPYPETGVTFNPSEIANQNSNYNNSSEVPKVKFEDNGKNTTIVAKELQFSSSYLGSENTRKIAIPYKESTGKPISQDESLYISTVESGVTDQAEPWDYSRTRDLLESYDTVSDNVMSNFVDQYAKDLWNKYLSDIANSDKSIYDDPNITSELSQLQISVEPSSVDSVIASYYGSYGSTVSPWDTSVTVENVNNRSQHEGALFTSNMTDLLNDTNKSDVMETGDILNTTDVERTFVVNHNDASVQELTGQEYEVISIEDIGGNETVQLNETDVRTFDFTDTDLSDQAVRLSELEKALDIVNDGNGGDGISIGLPNFGGNIIDGISDFVNNSALSIWFVLIILLLVLVLILSILS